MGEEIEVDEMGENGFREVEFEEIKIGFEETHEDLALSKDLTNEDLIKFWSLGFMSNIFEKEKVENLDLEEVLLDVVIEEEKQDSENDNFYRTENSIEEIYQTEIYDTKNAYGEEFVDINDINVSSNIREDSREQRSMLEISGFKDVEAEKNREDKRRFWNC